MNIVVELTSPSMASDDLSYSVTDTGGTGLPTTMIACDVDSHLFVDVVNNEPCLLQRTCDRVSLLLPVAGEL